MRKKLNKAERQALHKITLEQAVEWRERTEKTLELIGQSAGACLETVTIFLSLIGMVTLVSGEIRNEEMQIFLTTSCMFSMLWSSLKCLVHITHGYNCILGCFAAIISAGVVVWIPLEGNAICNRLFWLVTACIIVRVVVWVIPRACGFVSEIRSLYLQLTRAPAEIGKKKSRDEQLAKTVLIHEAGHACMSAMLGIPLKEIYISGDAGYVKQFPHNSSSDMIEKDILTLYAGLAAERIYKNSDRYLSSSALLDIREATRIIQEYFFECGGNGLLINMYAFLSFRKRRNIKQKCVEFSLNCEKKAMELLKKNKKKLELTIQFLMGKELVTTDEWEAFCRKSRVNDKGTVWDGNLNLKENL